MLTRIALVGCVMAFVGGTARAQDKPLDRAEIDKRAALVAYEAALAGTEIYNGGRHAECARLYQGTLQALLPMLDHRPTLTATIKEKLEAARVLRAPEAATAMREALDAVMGHAPRTVAATLWDRLGGEKAVRVVVHDVAVAAASDPKVNLTRGGQFKLDDKAVERLEQLLVEFVSANAGGPLKYTGRDMATVHKGMKITDAEFDALVEHLRATLKKHKVPERDADELAATVEKTRKQVVEAPKN